MQHCGDKRNVDNSYIFLLTFIDIILHTTPKLLKHSLIYSCMHHFSESSEGIQDIRSGFRSESLVIVGSWDCDQWWWREPSYWHLQGDVFSTLVPGCHFSLEMTDRILKGFAVLSQIFLKFVHKTRQIGKNWCSNSAVDEWSRLNNHIVRAQTLGNFKRRLDKFNEWMRMIGENKLRCSHRDCHD